MTVPDYCKVSELRLDNDFKNIQRRCSGRQHAQTLILNTGPTFGNKRYYMTEVLRTDAL